MPTSFRTTRRDLASNAVPEHHGEHVDDDPVDQDDTLEPTDPEPAGRAPADPEPAGRAPRPEPPEDSDGFEEAHWNDEGESWWAPHPVPPSYRDAT